MKHLVRVAAMSPQVHIGNVTKNCEEIEAIYRAYAEQADIIVTPELSLTGYTCGDLFVNRRLISQAVEGLVKLAKITAEYGETGAALVVGVPFEVEGELFNCGAFLVNGKVAALVPKTYLPNYGEFYEKRWFSGRCMEERMVELPDKTETLFGSHILIELEDEAETVTVGMEICEDLWTPISPGRLLALEGAEIILNLSASNEVIGKEQYRKTLGGGMSSSCICGYVYASAGTYESTSDLVFSGHNLMYENGKLLGENKPFEHGVLIRDFNLTKIRHDRLANKSFAECKRNFSLHKYQTIVCRKKFTEKKDASCVVVGVSGGLDSTLALLVSAQAVKNLNLSPKMVVGITMPGFGTTKRTKSNSTTLMELLGCSIREISIVDSVRQHFADIGQDEAVQDITYENCQARERTQILLDVANKEGGFVVGTGDLSELALGWCTYNGDHMSMYAVNTSIPKTLVRTLVDEVGHHMGRNGFEGIEKVIEDIIDTPVSPELLPPNADGTIAQKTEDTVGSYILHDFFLYYTLRYGMEPEEVFYTRFFRQQFKRNCMPDGVKVGTVSVSPRGDLRLPSEIEPEDFLEF